MMTKHVVRVSMISILEACRNKVVWPQFTIIAPPPPPPPLPEQFNFNQQPQLRFHNNNNNLCVDLYFHCAKGQGAMSTVEFHKTLMNQVFPSAWSHNPLTTLKLICNFIERRRDGGNQPRRSFLHGGSWLHQNHPKTLAYNLMPISGSFGHILDPPCILSQILRGEAPLKFTRRTREEADSNGMVKVKEKDAKSKASKLLLRRKAIYTANKAAQRYEGDADYCFLHDCVSDIFAQCLKSDIEKFHHHKDHDHDHHDGYCLEITQAATSLPTIADHYMLFENIARKVFPPESCRRKGDGSVCCIDRLRNEVLTRPDPDVLGTPGWSRAGRHPKGDESHLIYVKAE